MGWNEGFEFEQPRYRARLLNRPPRRPRIAAPPDGRRSWTGRAFGPQVKADDNSAQCMKVSWSPRVLQPGQRHADRHSLIRPPNPPELLCPFISTTPSAWSLSRRLRMARISPCSSAVPLSGVATSGAMKKGALRTKASLGLW
jgi:hypothetical protein